MSPEEERKPDVSEAPEQPRAETKAVELAQTNQAKSDEQQGREADQEQRRRRGYTPSSSALPAVFLDRDGTSRVVSRAPDVPLSGEAPGHASKPRDLYQWDGTDADYPPKAPADAPPEPTVTLDVVRVVGEYVGEPINRQLEPQTVNNPDGRLLTDIAREHLGAGATDDEVRKHVTEIVRLNWIQALDVNTPLILGQPLRLPGHTGDGGFITMDRAGNKRTVWDDGTVRIENTDGTGSTRKWQGEGKAYKENHRGPDPEDNYELRRTEDGKYEVAEADTENFRAQTNEEADLRVERARLKDLADERINDVEHRAAFEADMDRFEKRSKTLEEMYVKEGMSREDAQKMARQDVAKELKEKLEGARKDGKFPLLIHVHTRKEPFWSDSNAGKAGGSGGHHMISITDYDPVTGKVSVDNQWGKSADHFGNDGVPVADLYKATTSVYEDLMLEIEANRKSGGADAEKELELVEIARLEGRITAKDYEEAVVSVVLQSETRWQDKVDSERSGLEAQERQAEVGKVLEFINSMPTDERQEFLKRLDQELEKQKKARAQK